MEKLQIEIPLPSQGINYADDSLISNHEAAEGTINILFKDGMPQSRKGYIKQQLYAHTGEAYGITRLFFHYVGSEKRMVYNILAGTTNALYQMNEDKNPVQRILGTINISKPALINVTCALSGGVPYTEKVFILDGTAFKYFDETTGLTAVPAYTPTPDEINAFGTNVIATDEVVKQKYALLDNGRLWLAGYGQIVRMCHIGLAGIKPDYFPSTHVFKMPEDVTGIVSFMDEVIIFSENTAVMISGNTVLTSSDGSYVYNSLPGGYGCAAHESIVVGDNCVYWANRTGIFRYRYTPTGFAIPECISEFLLADGHSRTIRKKLNTITDWTKVFAVYFDHEYRLYIGNGEVLVFDSITSTWALFSYANLFGCGTTYRDQLYYGGSSSDGLATPNYWIYQMDYPFNPDGATYDGLSDDGKAIICILKSKFFDFSKAANKKRFKKFYFTIYSELVSYDIDLVVNMDNEAQVMTSIISNKISRWGNSDPSDDTTESAYAFAFGDIVNTMRTNLNYPVRLRHRGKKYNIQYELQSSGLNHAWLLKAIVLMMKMKELK